MRRGRSGPGRSIHGARTPILAAAALVLVVLAGSAVADQAIQRISRDKNQTTLVTVLDTTHQALHSWASAHISSAALWAATSEVRSATERLLEAPRSPQGLVSDPAQSELRAVLAPVLASEGYRGFFVIAPDGVSLASTRDVNVGIKNLVARSQPAALERALAGETMLTVPQVSDVALTDAAGVLRLDLPTMFVGAPIRSVTGEVIAVLTFRIDPTTDFTPIVSQGRVGATGETLVFDGEGLLLGESRFEDELRRLGQLEEGEASPLNVQLRPPDQGTEGSLTQMAESALAGSDSSDLKGYVGYLGTRVIGVWEWDEDLGMGIAVEMSVEEAQRVSRWSRWAIVLLGAGTVASIFGLTFVFLRSERTLRQSEDRYRRLIEEASDAVVAVTADQRVVIFNQAAEDLFGYQSGEVIGQPLEMLLPEPMRGDHRQLAGGFIDDPGARRRMATARPDIPARKKHGSVFPVEVTIGKANLGAESLYLATVRDVSDARRTATALQRLTTELRARNGDLQQFVWIASHDLREPLRKVQAFGEQLEEAVGEHLGEWGRLSLDRIVDAARRMSALLDDLLVFSRITTQATSFRRVDLKQVAEEALNALEVLVEETEATVEVEPMPVVDGDPTQLGSVFQNLIGNAVKFHRPGVPPRVRVGPVVGKGLPEGWIRLVVEDNGIGFDPAYTDRIFEPFQRLHERGRYEGNGMGLTISRRIVERHGGRIFAESIPESGSRFTVELPITQPEEVTP